MLSCYRVKELEAKVVELESETDRLSTALEAQKTTAAEAQAAAAKKVDELSRDIQKKVGIMFMILANETIKFT